MKSFLLFFALVVTTLTGQGSSEISIPEAIGEIAQESDESVVIGPIPSPHVYFELSPVFVEQLKNWYEAAFQKIVDEIADGYTAAIYERIDSPALNAYLNEKRVLFISLRQESASFLTYCAHNNIQTYYLDDFFIDSYLNQLRDIILTRRSIMYFIESNHYSGAALLTGLHALDGVFKLSWYGNMLILGVGGAVIAYVVLEEVAKKAQQCTPTKMLHWAVAHDKKLLIHLLLGIGARVNSLDKNGQSALWKACSLKHTSIANLLLDKGANAQFPNAGWFVPIDALAARVSDPDIDDQNLFFRLLKAGLPSNVSISRSLLQKIYRKQGLLFHVEAVSLEPLSDFNYKNADVAGQDSFGKTALHLAAAFGNKKMVEYLLDHKVPLDIRDNEELLALSVARQAGETHIAQMVLAAQRAQVFSRLLSGWNGKHRPNGKLIEAPLPPELIANIEQFARCL